MNIFYVHQNPEISAQMLCDKHVVKMSLESVQMLTNCFSQQILAETRTPKTQKGAVRKYSHFNHPSSKWVRDSKANMVWLTDHAIAICQEKKSRYPKKPMPFVYDFLLWCQDNMHKSYTPDGQFTPPPQCMPDYCKVNNDTVLAYRNYYINEKKDIAKWKCDNKPEWF